MANLSLTLLYFAFAAVVLRPAVIMAADSDSMSTPPGSTYTVADLGVVTHIEQSSERGRPPAYDAKAITAGSVLDAGRWRAVLWKNDRPEYIEPVSDQESHALAINSRGQIVGDYGKPWHPVL